MEIIYDLLYIFRTIFEIMMFLYIIKSLKIYIMRGGM